MKHSKQVVYNNTLIWGYQNDETKTMSPRSEKPKYKNENIIELIKIIFQSKKCILFK